MSTIRNVVLPVLDIMGLDPRWPVGISILAFGFLIVNLVGLFYHYDGETKVILSATIPGTAFILILFLAYFPNYYLKLGEITSNLQNEPFEKIFLNTLYSMVFDIMGVVFGLALGLASIWAEPSIQLSISAFIFPIVCLTISRAYIRQGIIGRKIYDLISRLYNTIRNSFS